MIKYLLPAIILTLINCTKTRGDNDAIPDGDFVLQASVVNTAAIDLGNVESIKGLDETIKAFAQNITEYHKEVQTELKSLAMGLNLVTADSLDAEHVSLRNQLLDLSGHAFDSLYIHTRVQDYRQASKLFFEEMINGRNSQLKDYSASVLPQLEVYLHRADSLASKY